MKRLTKKQDWFKQQMFTAQDKLYVGLDVHKSSIAVAFWLNDRIVLTFNTSAQHAPLIKQLLRVKKVLQLIVYEAGPTGYSLARDLQEAGLPVRIISPATTPRPAQTRTKTDSLDIHLAEMDHLQTSIQEVEAQLESLCQQQPHRRAMTILQSHPGVGPVTAWSFHFELFRPQRFTKPSQIAAFIGLAPRLHQTGTRSRGGPIVKTGREQLRSKLIEAAWAWMHNDPAARDVYYRLCRNTANNNKAIVGLARRLAIHLWTMLCTQQCYRPAA